MSCTESHFKQYASVSNKGMQPKGRYAGKLELPKKRNKWKYRNQRANTI